MELHWHWAYSVHPIVNYKTFTHWIVYSTSTPPPSPAPCTGIRIPESEKFVLVDWGYFFLVESRILDFGTRNTAQGIQNSTNDKKLESKFHLKRLEVHYLESEINSVEYRIQDSLGFPYMERSLPFTKDHQDGALYTIAGG